MSTNPMRCTWAGCIFIAFAALVASATPTVGSAEDRTEAAPVIVAQAATADVAMPTTVPMDAFPALERGVREAAAESNEALRRYVYRTRMIYDFHFDRHAPRD